MKPAEITAILRGDVVNALVANTPGGIERQEREGRLALVNSSALPKQIRAGTKEQFVELGFKFGDDVDDLFVSCELPPGWTKSADDNSSNSYYTSVLDEQGRERAVVFYKAAFYDRRANMSLLRRYELAYVPEQGNPDGDDHCVIRDNATNTVVFDGGVYVFNGDEFGVAERACDDWLKSTYPDWNNQLAYW